MSADQMTATAESARAGLSVTILEHPAGFLMRLEHDGACLTLDRAEAFGLHAKIAAKLGGMPVNIGPS